MKVKVSILVALLSAMNLHAQSLTPASGYSTTELFNLGTGVAISALGAGPAGEIYYLATGSFGETRPGTQLFRASPADSFSTHTSLFSYKDSGGQPLSVFGSFIRVAGDTIYFGESSTGEIRNIPLSGGISGVLKTVPNHYDGAILGGAVLVSAADQNFANNQVYRRTPGATALDRIVNTGGASGPVAADRQGNLIYGASTFSGGTGGLYRYTQAQIASVTDSDPAVADRSLSLEQGARLFGSGPSAFSGSSQYLSYRDDAHLFQADSPFGARATLQRFDLTTVSREVVAQSGAGEFFGGIAHTDSALYAVLSNVDGASAVFMIIPEPACSFLILAGVFSLGQGRRYQRRSVSALTRT